MSTREVVVKRAEELYEEDRALRIPGTIGNVPWNEQDELIQAIWIQEAEIEAQYGTDRL